MIVYSNLQGFHTAIFLEHTDAPSEITNMSRSNNLCRSLAGCLRSKGEDIKYIKPAAKVWNPFSNQRQTGAQTLIHKRAPSGKVEHCLDTRMAEHKSVEQRATPHDASQTMQARHATMIRAICTNMSCDTQTRARIGGIRRSESPNC